MGSQTPRDVTFPPAKQAETYEKRRRAAELRRAGWTWGAIAGEVGYSDRGSACAAVKALLKEHQSLAYDEIALYRQESLDRLTDLLKVAMMGALAGDEKMMRESRLIISQIGDLTGEKAPLQVQIGESDVDRLLREALDEFQRRTAQLDRKVGADPGRAAQDG
jgi:hypothetical protein